MCKCWAAGGCQRKRLVLLELDRHPTPPFHQCLFAGLAWQEGEEGLSGRGLSLPGLEAAGWLLDPGGHDPGRALPGAWCVSSCLQLFCG